MAHTLFHRIVRHAASTSIKWLAAEDRAAVIESLSATAIAEVHVDGGRIKFYAPSMLLRHRAVSLLSKEPDTIQWLDTLGADDTLWDIGANVGVFSLYAAKLRKSRVFAFEPASPNYFALTRNVDLNQLSSRVTAYCLAVAGATHFGVINLHSAEPGAAASHFGDAGQASPYAPSAPVTQHGMIGFTIDDLVSRFGVPPPTQLKLDVDGLEYPILQGARTTLQDRRLRSVMVELPLDNDSDRDAAARLMNESGLALRAQGAVQTGAGQRAANHLFVRTE